MIEYPEEYDYDDRLEGFEGVTHVNPVRSRQSRYSNFLSGCALGGMLTIVGLYVTLYAFRDQLDSFHRFFYAP